MTCYFSEKATRGERQQTSRLLAIRYTSGSSFDQMVAAVHFITPILNKTRQNMKIIFEFNQVQIYNDPILYGKFQSIKTFACSRFLLLVRLWYIINPQVRFTANDRVFEVLELMTTLRVPQLTGRSFQKFQSHGVHYSHFLYFDSSVKNVRKTRLSYLPLFGIQKL